MKKKTTVTNSGLFGQIRSKSGSHGKISDLSVQNLRDQTQ